MQAREAVARTAVVTVGTDETLERAARLMLAHGIRHLPVLEADGRLVGLLSERDVLGVRGYGVIAMQSAVRTAMATPVETARADAPLEEVAERLATRRIGCLPLVDGDRLVGILTTTDLLAQQVDRRRAVRALEGVASDVMTHDPVTAHPDDLLLDAVARMSQRGVRHLPVVDGLGRPLGMLSDRDVRRVLGNLASREGESGLERRVAEYRVGDVATIPVMTVEPETTLELVVRRFVDDRVGALAVVADDGTLAGIVSYIDVLKTLVGERHEPAETAAFPPEPSLSPS